MKAILAIFLGLFAVAANAGGIDCRSGVDHKHPSCFTRHAPVVVHHHMHNRHHWNHHRHHPVIVHRHHDNWVAPLVGGVILGAVIADANAKEREERVIIKPQPVTPRNCTEWKEVMTDEGKIYRERICRD